MAQVARAADARRAAAPQSLKRLTVQFRGMGFLEQEITVTGTVRDVADGVALVDTRGRAGRQRIIRNAEAELRVG